MVPTLPLVSLLVATSPPSELRAVRLVEPPVIDGRLDDAAWAGILGDGAFTQKQPRPGAPPVEPTHVRVGYDDRALYVAVDCTQRTAPVTARLTRRDRAAEADWVAVVVDSHGEGQGAFEFQVNAAGVLADALRFDDVQLAPEWDEIWEARAALTPDGWAAELRIPLRVLRFPDRPVHDFGLQVRRHVAHRLETDEWAFIPPSAAGEVSRYGRLAGLRGLSDARGVELAPFARARLRRADPAPDRAHRAPHLDAAAGLDLRWRLGPTLVIDAALLPDFGQVEADQLSLNLTNFETVYPEKRRFFLEGTDTFATQEIQLIYTRRIGRLGAGPALAEGERLVDAPTPAPLWGALKLTGQPAPGWALGVLAAITGPAASAIEGADGVRSRRAGDPSTLFQVLRLRRALGGSGGTRGHLGLTATSVLRLGHEPPPLPDAHVVGLDGRWRSASGNQSVSAALATSLLARGPVRVQPDGTRIGPGQPGTAARLVISQDGGGRWLGSVWGAADAARFDPNDLGYLDRANQRGSGFELAFRTREPHAGTLETTTKLTGALLYDEAGLVTQRALTLSGSARLASFWTTTAEISLAGSRFDDRELGDGAALERATTTSFALRLASDPRTALAASAAVAGDLLSGGRALRAETTLTVRPLPELDLEFTPHLVLAEGEPRAVPDTDAEAPYRLGRLRAVSADAVVRATYTFTPRLSVQAYAQLFLARREYRAQVLIPRAVAGGHPPVIRLATLALAPPASEAIDVPGESALDGNLVLRWEFQPGCLLYLVFTRAQSLGLVPPSGTRPRWRGPAADEIMMKFGYWWG